MRNLILSTDNSLSLAAGGLLTAMVNCPEKDYSTIDELYESSNDDFDTIETAVYELVDTEYLLCIGDRFAVNKIRIPEMKVISSAEKLVRTFRITADEHDNSGI